MIGKVKTGKSFRGCLLYCLHDKSPQNKLKPVMEKRAELIAFNQCFGNDKELIRQFGEVRQLNPKLAKPVMHITLSMAPGEQLSDATLCELTDDCARELGFAANQYVAVLHKDTQHQHLHIVANRVGFDGKTVNDSNSYKKIAAYCRKMELKHNLQRVLSPRKYLPQQQRNLPRLDQRKEKLQAAIVQSALRSPDYLSFKEKMQQLGYEVLKGRGIAFRDKEKVYTKGSEVGFSWAKLERILHLSPERKMQLLQQATELVKRQNRIFDRNKHLLSMDARQRTEAGLKVPAVDNTRENVPGTTKTLVQSIEKVIAQLFRQEFSTESVNQELLSEEQKRKRRQRLRR